MPAIAKLATSVQSRISPSAWRHCSQQSSNQQRRVVRRAMAALAAAFVLLPVAGMSETIVRTTNFRYNATGQLQKEVVEPGDSNLCVVTQYTYGSFGNKQTATTRNCDGSDGEAAAPAAGTDPVFAPRQSTFGYEPSGRFLRTTTNPLSQTVTNGYDEALGVVTSVTDANGIVVYTDYDDLGRRKKERRPDGSSTTWTYVMTAASVETNPAVATDVDRWILYEAPSDGPLLTSVRDSLGREVRGWRAKFSVGAPAASSYLVSGIDYLDNGLPTRRYVNVDPAVSTPSTSVAYDTFWRPQSQTAPGGFSTTFSYNGRQSTVTDANGKNRTTVINLRGQTEQVVDHNAKTLSYTYDATGNLKTTTDSLGNVTTVGYDLRGRKRTLADPDTGSWSYDYDAAGQMKRQTDAKAQVTTYAYDLLGRMTSRSEGAFISNWYYDKKANNSTCGAAGVGRLCEATTSTNFGRVLSYDNKGRVTSSSTVLDSSGTSYVVSQTYDTNSSRLASRTWPASSAFPSGYTVNFSYTPDGYSYEARQASGNALLWRADAMLAGQLTQYTTGDNVVHYASIDPTTQRLSALAAGSGMGAGATVLNQSYQYDSAGNLKVRTDAATNACESMDYDNLHRLTDYRRGTSCASPTEGTHWDLDEIGNIRVRTQNGITLTYAYPNSGGGSVRPHAVSGITGTVDWSSGQATNPGYTYDANGNMVRNASRTVIYNSFNLPDTICASDAGNPALCSSVAGSPAETFNYDSAHQRVRQVATSGSTTTTTLYLNPADGAGLMYERVSVSTGGSTRTRDRYYISAGGRTLGVYTVDSGAAASMRYWNEDQQGNVVAVTQANGSGFSVCERFRYRPYGERITVQANCDVALPTERGFTEHEHLEEHNLVHMNGRVFDPVINRFMSADPLVQAPGNLQSYNRYTYGLGSPMMMIDPSGYSWWTSIRGVVVAAAAAYIATQTGIYISDAFSAGALQAGGSTAFATVASTTAEGYAQTFAVNTTALGGGIAGAGGGAVGGLVASGGDLRAAGNGAVTGGIFGAIGSLGTIEGFSNAEFVAAHAAGGCAAGAATVGDCGSGAASAAFGKITTFMTQGQHPLIQGIGSATAGGFGAWVAGGKFGDGFRTAAFAYMFNYCSNPTVACAKAWANAIWNIATGGAGAATSVGLCGTFAGCAMGLPLGIISAGKAIEGVDWVLNGNETTAGRDPVKNTAISAFRSAGMSAGPATMLCGAGEILAGTLSLAAPVRLSEAWIRIGGPFPSGLPVTVPYLTTQSFRGVAVGSEVGGGLWTIGQGAAGR